MSCMILYLFRMINILLSDDSLRDVCMYKVNCYKYAVGMTGILCTCMINSSQLRPI